MVDGGGGRGVCNFSYFVQRGHFCLVWKGFDKFWFCLY